MADEGEDGIRLLDRPGTLDESYLLGVLIGRGSYSMVHKCIYKGKSERACKVYKKVHLNTSSVASHVDSILKLSHPNLISVHDVFETDSVLQVVTDLAAGQELLERIEGCDHYSEKDAALAVRTILSALQYLHSQDLPHGGLYPENLLYESTATTAKLKLSEIAMPKKALTPSSPPPIYTVSDPRSSPLHSRCATDLWNLAVLIYIMLCGSEPSADTLAEMAGEKDVGDWAEVSSSARHLITALINGQLTAEEALGHPWVSGSTAASSHKMDTQERLKTFNARRKLKATTHAIIATQRAMSSLKPYRQPLR